MNKKVLKATFPEKCIGCELCVMASQRMLGKAGFGESRVRIFRTKTGFDIHLEPEVNDQEVEEIVAICPKECFTIEITEKSQPAHLNFQEDINDQSQN